MGAKGFQWAERSAWESGLEATGHYARAAGPGQATGAAFRGVRLR
jgi:hypothetical protein